jgi:hypothetical protein
LTLLAHVGDLAGLGGVGGVVVVVEVVDGGRMSKKFGDFLDASFSASFTRWRMKRKRESCQLRRGKTYTKGVVVSSGHRW